MKNEKKSGIRVNMSDLLEQQYSAECAALRNMFAPPYVPNRVDIRILRTLLHYVALGNNVLNMRENSQEFKGLYTNTALKHVFYRHGLPVDKDFAPELATRVLLSGSYSDFSAFSVIGVFNTGFDSDLCSMLVDLRSLSRTGRIRRLKVKPVLSSDPLIGAVDNERVSWNNLILRAPREEVQAATDNQIQGLAAITVASIQTIAEVDLLNLLWEEQGEEFHAANDILYSMLCPLMERLGVQAERETKAWTHSLRFGSAVRQCRDFLMRLDTLRQEPAHMRLLADMSEASQNVAGVHESLSTDRSIRLVRRIKQVSQLTEAKRTDLNFAYLQVMAAAKSMSRHAMADLFDQDPGFTFNDEYIEDMLSRLRTVHSDLAVADNDIMHQLHQAQRLLRHVSLHRGERGFQSHDLEYCALRRDVERAYEDRLSLIFDDI